LGGRGQKDCGSGDDALVMGEFGNAVDAKLTW
jgi:hypothetical protein